MATCHRILIGLLPVFASVLLVGSLGCSPIATDIPTNKVPWQVEMTAHQLMRQLDGQGYEMLRGYFKLYTTADCDASYEAMHTCYGNNPAAPYVIPVVPPWPTQPGPGEWVDPATNGALGKTADGYNSTYRLDPHEALVILAQMPPPASYFGLKTYLFTRSGALCNQSTQYNFVQQYIPALLPTFFSLVPNEPASATRVQIIADLSNSPNNVIIANQSGSVWNQFRYFVITPNPAMDSAIRDAFAKIGISANNIFTEKIPANFPTEPNPPACPDAAALRFGLGRQADDFVTVVRYAMPVDDGAADGWRLQLPMIVLRIRNSAADDQIYPWENFEPRSPSNPPETSYASDLNALSGAVCSILNTAGTQDCTQWKQFLNLQTAPLLLTGPACVPAWMNCLAPDEDTTYEMSAKLPLDSDHFYAVAGPLSTATQNATYVGLGLNSSLRQLGFDNITNVQLAGSAAGYSSAIPSDKFFVQYFARDCTGLDANLPSGVSFHCYSIGDKLPSCDPSDPACDMLGLSLRSYLRPGTQRATDQNSVLNSRYILLKKP